MFYSTPSCYVKAVLEDALKKEITFPIKTDDFFPYASDSHAYWTGYYTSRPTLKRFERQGSNFLEVSFYILKFFLSNVFMIFTNVILIDTLLVINC